MLLASIDKGLKTTKQAKSNCTHRYSEMSQFLLSKEDFVLIATIYYSTVLALKNQGINCKFLDLDLYI